MDYREIIADGREAMVKARKEGRERGLSGDEFGNYMHSAINKAVASRGLTSRDIVAAIQYEKKHGRLPSIEELDLREVAGGYSFEFADEAEAAIMQFFGDETYNERLDRIADMRRLYADMFPVRAITNNMMGAAITGIGLFKNAPRYMQQMAARNPFKSSVAGGAVGGGIAGAGLNQDDRLGGANTGAQLGALFSVGGYGAVRGAQAVRNRIGNRGDDLAIMGRMADDGVTPDDLRDQIKINEAADTEAGVDTLETLADLAGDSTRRQLRGARVISGGANSRIDDVLDTRQRGTPMNADQQVLMQSERVARDVDVARDEAFRDSIATVEELGSAQYKNPEVSKLYTAAYEANKAVTDVKVVSMIANNSNLRRAYAEMRQAALDNRGDDIAKQAELMSRLPENPRDLLNEAGDAMAEGYEESGITLAMLDQIKKFEGNRIYKSEAPLAINPQGGNKEGAAREYLGKYTDALKNATGGAEAPYGQVLAITADDFAIQDAINAAKKIMSQPNAKAQALFGELSPMQQDAVRITFLDELIQQIKRKPSGSNATSVVDDSAVQREKLELIFKNDNDALSRFLDRVERERQMFVTRARVGGGSNTADKQMDAAATLGQAARIAADPLIEGGRTALAVGQNLAMPGAAARRADTLLTQGPNEQRAVLDRFDRLTDTLEAQRSIAGGTGVATGLLGNQLLNR